MLAKIPPPPAADGHTRTTVQGVTVSFPARANSTAYLRHGYRENAAVGSMPPPFTSRQESCASAVLSSGSLYATNPFWFETVGNSSLVPVECSTGCSLQFPGIAQRIAYYQWVYKDISSGVLKPGPLEVTAVP